VDSLGVPLGVQQSAWAECGRSRLLTSLARPGVGCSPLCLGQESDPCSSVWPGCRSLCSSVWTGLSWSLVSLLQCLDWLLRCLHWLLCAGGLVFGCLLQWSWWSTVGCTGVCLSRYTTRPTWWHDLLHLLWDSPLWQSRWSPSVSFSGQEFLHSQFRWSPQFTTPVSVVSSVHSSVDSLSRSLQCGLQCRSLRQSVTPCARPFTVHPLHPEIL